MALTPAERLAVWARIRDNADQAIELLGYAARASVRLNPDKVSTAIALTPAQKQTFLDQYLPLEASLKADAASL